MCLRKGGGSRWGKVGRVGVLWRCRFRLDVMYLDSLISGKWKIS